MWAIIGASSCDQRRRGSDLGETLDLPVASPSTPALANGGAVTSPALRHGLRPHAAVGKRRSRTPSHRRIAAGAMRAGVVSSWPMILNPHLCCCVTGGVGPLGSAHAQPRSSRATQQPPSVFAARRLPCHCSSATGDRSPKGRDAFGPVHESAALHLGDKSDNRSQSYPKCAGIGLDTLQTLPPYYPPGEAELQG